jgi:hypothetical protein
MQHLKKLPKEIIESNGVALNISRQEQWDQGNFYF